MVGTAYRYRARGSLPESAGVSRGAVAYGAPSLRHRYAVRRFESPAADQPERLLAPGYR